MSETLNNVDRLTAFRPARVHYVAPIWTESSVKYTPSNISGLNRFEQFELAPSCVINAYVTICKKKIQRDLCIKSYKIPNIRPLKRENLPCDALRKISPDFEYKPQKAL